MTNKKKILAITGFILFCGLFFSCSSTRSVGTIAASFPVKDSVHLAHSNEGFVFLADSLVKVRSFHGQDSIWIEVKAHKEISSRSMLINGLSIWLDPEAKKNEKYGISFPAARAEMLRRQDELLRKMRESGDSLKPMPFDPQPWVDAVNERNAVVKEKNGTRFAGTDIAKVYLDHDGKLVYRIRFSFSQMGVDKEEISRFSIGVVSEQHQAQLLGANQGSSVATGASRGHRSRTAPDAPSRPDQRVRLVPVKDWVVFLLNPEEVKDPVSQKGNRKNDMYPY